MHKGSKNNLVTTIVDWLIAAIIFVFGPALKVHAKWRIHFPLAQKSADFWSISVRWHHYYEPTFNPKSIKRRLDEERDLPGIELNEAGQLAIIKNFKFADELRAIPLDGDVDGEFAYNRGPFNSGDAETLYNFVRYLKPRRIVEVGSGMSTLMARLAISANQRDDPRYSCDHICIEPFEQPWLESTGAIIIRELVENTDLTLFTNLQPNDILFVDSSHVIRPQGDVLHEMFQIYPSLAGGVYVHVHDIFTPRDYLPDWILRGDRKLWNEQYLLEAFLSFNREFEIVAAMNWLAHTHPEKLVEACPILMQQPGREPGSFWFRRKLDTGQKHEL
jgi:hypothetical protein